MNVGFQELGRDDFAPKISNLFLIPLGSDPVFISSFNPQQSFWGGDNMTFMYVDSEKSGSRLFRAKIFLSVCLEQHYRLFVYFLFTIVTMSELSKK